MATNCLFQPQLAPLPPPGLPPATGLGAGQGFPPLPARNLELVPMPAPPPARRTAAAPRRPLTQVGPWLATTLEQRWECYCAELERCRKKPTEEAVHDLRVATRRLLAKLSLLSAVVPGTAPEKARRLLKARLKALGELRDVHVLRLFFDGQTGAFPELILVRDALARLERRLIKSVGRKVAGFKSRKLEKCLAGIIKELTAHAESVRVQRALQAAVLQATEGAFEEVIQRRHAIKPSVPQTIHRTRIAFKRFRYMVESLSPAITGLGRQPLRALGQYQRKMGAIQDLEVIQACVNDYLEDHAHAQPLMEPFCRYLRRRQGRALRRFLKSADDLFGFWPPPALRPEGEPKAPAK